jgi:hypothetical protein
VFPVAGVGDAGVSRFVASLLERLDGERELTPPTACLNLIWPHLVGGCEMTRDTEKWLKAAGPWSNVDLRMLEGEPWYFTMPHLIGVLTK